MRTALFYLAALALHALVLFCLPAPTPPATLVPVEKKYIEVTLTAAPPSEAPSVPPTPAPPPPPEAPPPQPPPPPPQIIEPPPPLPPPAVAPEEPISPPVPAPSPTPSAPPAPTPPATPATVANTAPSAPVTTAQVAAPAPKQYLQVTNPSYASKIEPDYPLEARRTHQQGTVVLALYINEFGTLDKVEIVKSSGHPLLDRAAEDAMQQSRFSPAYSGNIPMPSRAEVSITFQLELPP